MLAVSTAAIAHTASAHITIKTIAKITIDIVVTIITSIMLSTYIHRRTDGPVLAAQRTIHPPPLRAIVSVVVTVRHDRDHWRWRPRRAKGGLWRLGQGGGHVRKVTIG